MAKEILVKSTSGVRGVVGRGLDPILATRYAAAFGTFLKSGKVVVGRDSRPSGEMIKAAVVSGLRSVGIDVIDIDVAPTPTVEIAVKQLKAAGGICVTASHNPAQWNALKFFNSAGEFITPAEYKRLNRNFESGKFLFRLYNELGSVIERKDMVDVHIRKVLAMNTINRTAIRKRRLRVVVDAINSAGSFALPELLKRLGCRVVCINCRGDGNFVHEPEPVPANLRQLSREVKRHKADIGMACDPDADRLALVDERGHPIGEELTLTIGVMQVLSGRKGPTVINLSTSRATADIARQMGSKVWFSKVGEANVVKLMHEKKGVIGGEGNGGVIYPACHAGRDALVAAALVLGCLAEQNIKLSHLVETFPAYYTIKAKAPLPPDFTERLTRFQQEAFGLLGKCKIDRRDGLKLDFADGWVQIRSSNTEPIYRLIVETNRSDLTARLSKLVRKSFK